MPVVDMAKDIFLHCVIKVIHICVVIHNDTCVYNGISRKANDLKRCEYVYNQ